MDGWSSGYDRWRAALLPLLDSVQPAGIPEEEEEGASWGGGANDAS